MAAMMLMLINFKIILKINNINIIAAILWPPPLILQLFHPGFLKPHHVLTPWLFCVDFTFLHFLRHQNQAMADLMLVFTHISSFLYRYNDRGGSSGVCEVSGNRSRLDRDTLIEQSVTLIMQSQYSETMKL